MKLTVLVGQSLLAEDEKEWWIQRALEIGDLDPLAFKIFSENEKDHKSYFVGQNELISCTLDWIWCDICESPKHKNSVWGSQV